MRIGKLAGALLTTLTIAPMADASPAPVSIVVICAELSAEERAHVEAMVRADLLTRAVSVMRVQLECRSDWVTADFDLGSGRVSSHGEPKASSRTHIAEQLIALSDRLNAADLSASSGDSAGVDAPPSPSSIPNAETDERPKGAASSGIGSGVASTSALNAALAPPLEARVAESYGRMALHGTVQLIPPRKILSPPLRSVLGFELLGGLEFAPFLPHSWGAAGPRVGFAAVIQQRFAVTAIAGLGWALERPQRVALRDQRAGLGLEWRARPPITLGFNLLLTALRVSVPDEFSPSNRWSAIEPACHLYAGYRWEFGALSFAIQPTVTIYAHPRIVRLDANAILDIPPLLVGVVAQTAWRL